MGTIFCCFVGKAFGSDCDAWKQKGEFNWHFSWYSGLLYPCRIHMNFQFNFQPLMGAATNSNTSLKWYKMNYVDNNISSSSKLGCVLSKAVKRCKWIAKAQQYWWLRAHPFQKQNDCCKRKKNGFFHLETFLFFLLAKTRIPRWPVQMTYRLLSW